MNDDDNPALESRESLNARLQEALSELQEKEETIQILNEQMQSKESMMRNLAWWARS